MKTKSKEKELYIRTLAIGVQHNGPGRVELSMICSKIIQETRSRLNAIESIQVRVAKGEHEIAAYDIAGEYLGRILYDSNFSELGAVAKLQKVLEFSPSLELRLFSMGEPDASCTKNVVGVLVFYASKTLPDLRIRRAA